ncbi:hypothetical protein [Mycoplasma capricolum]|uniref:Uncharacterized protein n=1 Tax=Mycoplasma capricolum subsp. capricolum (strain California kid / ATCC 27343 / NCTC 10154) TaxID=340047 RepID=Q2SSI1_MYCCT|nr:hypothetical protein [Mycoplasma capricolum]ABC01403.1 conserved hypothetical protein [Mycoplasma capricolum subsp. capricolum ATCC 27343]
MKIIEEIVGQEKILNKLITYYKNFEQNRTPSPFILIIGKQGMGKFKISKWIHSHFDSNAIGVMSALLFNKDRLPFLVNFSQREIDYTSCLFKPEKVDKNSQEFLNFIFKRDLKNINKTLIKVDKLNKNSTYQYNDELLPITLEQLNNFRFICFSESKNDLSKNLLNKFDYIFEIKSYTYKEIKSILHKDLMHINNYFTNNSIKHIIYHSKLNPEIAKLLLKFADIKLESDELVSKVDLKELFNKFNIYNLNNDQILDLCFKHNCMVY